MKFNLLKLIPAGALLCFLITSCKKNDAVNTQATNPATSNTVRTTSMIGAMENESDNALSDMVVSNSITSCPTITTLPHSNPYPLTKVFDYGTGCTDADGVTRSGKKFVIIYADQTTAPAGKLVSVTSYSNYYVDGAAISGNIKVNVVSAAAPGPLVLRTAANQTVVDSAGNTCSYVSFGNRTQIAGAGTTTDKDDVYQITTNAYGTQVLGDSVIITWKSATDPSNLIIKQNTCSFRSQGGLQISLKEDTNVTTEYLDYGNGTCDDKATVSINGGEAKPVKLPFRFFAISF